MDARRRTAIPGVFCPSHHTTKELKNRKEKHSRFNPCVHRHRGHCPPESAAARVHATLTLQQFVRNRGEPQARLRESSKRLRRRSPCGEHASLRLMQMGTLDLKEPFLYDLDMPSPAPWPVTSFFAHSQNVQKRGLKSLSGDGLSCPFVTWSTCNGDRALPFAYSLQIQKTDMILDLGNGHSKVSISETTLRCSLRGRVSSGFSRVSQICFALVSRHWKSSPSNFLTL